MVLEALVLRHYCKRGSALLGSAISRSGCGIWGTSQAAADRFNRVALSQRNYGFCDNLGSRHMRHSDARDRGMLGTTVLCVRKDDKVIVIGDGQVTLGAEIIKPNVRKVQLQTLSPFLNDLRASLMSILGRYKVAPQIVKVDAVTSLIHCLLSLTRAAVELAKAWRSDKFLRRLDAVMVVADAEISLTITGNGDVLEPYDGVIGIGSGGSYASAAARALIDLPSMDAETIALKSMKIAADCCIYTNHNFTIQWLQSVPRRPEVENEAANISTDTTQAEEDQMKQQ